MSTISLSNSAGGAGTAMASDLGIMVVENARGVFLCACCSVRCANAEDFWLRRAELQSGARLWRTTLRASERAAREDIVRGKDVYADNEAAFGLAARLR